ncbi:MAG: nucleotidyltransferase [Chitinivibrionales bacterium]|nr:nucleotidyltransferase [Chitinivibrionales bacterium]
MAQPTLIIMAAGIGNRYGGLKQIDPIGPGGETLLDYSSFDAIRAGFGKIVFIIRKDFESRFRDRIGKNVEKNIDTQYVFQEFDRGMPQGFVSPPERTKPWGTGHALLVCKDAVTTPFAAINADDYYGQTSYVSLKEYLEQARDTESAYDYCAIGYELQNTLSDYGHVTRGVCEITQDYYLTRIRELKKIQRFDNEVKYETENGEWHGLDPKSVTSMNMWGFTLSFFDELESRFAAFLEKNGKEMKAEFLVPEIVGNLIKEKKAAVKIIPTEEKWFGLTYGEDKPRVQEHMRKLLDEGVYPEKLWK